MADVKIQTGDLLFFRPTGWFGRIVCWLTRSRYCHVGIAEVDSRNDTIWIVHFMNDGFRYERLCDVELAWPGSAEVFRVKAITQLQRNVAAAYMRDRKGERYGYFHVVVTGLLRLVPRWVARNCFQAECERPNPHCSEAVCWAYRHAVVDLVETKPDWNTAPGDIVKSKKVEKVNCAYSTCNTS